MWGNVLRIYNGGWMGLHGYGPKGPLESAGIGSGRFAATTTPNCITLGIHQERVVNP